MIIANREDQYWATRVNWEDMADLIRKKWDQGYAITDMTYGDGVYYVLLERGSGIVSQEFVWKNSLRKTYKEYTEILDNLCITSFFCNESSCCLIRSGFEHDIEQIWRGSESFPKEDIERYWKIGYTITGMNWSDGFWLILFSRVKDYAQRESWETTFTLNTKRLIKNLNHDSRIVTSVCFGDGKWALSYARHPGIYSQQFYLGEKFPEEEITKLWNDNYDISKAAYANGLWFLTFINSYVETFDVQGRFDELYKARKYRDAQVLFKERLISSFQSPEPIILDYINSFIRLKKYDEGIEVFEHYNSLFGSYYEAMHLGGELYNLAYSQNQSEAYLRKALKCFSSVSTPTSEVEKKINELRSLLPDKNESESQWKQKLAMKEQEKRMSARESKYKKL